MWQFNGKCIDHTVFILPQDNFQQKCFSEINGIRESVHYVLNLRMNIMSSKHAPDIQCLKRSILRNITLLNLECINL